MKILRCLVPFLTILLFAFCIHITAFSQAAGGGGLSKPISSSLGGLVNSDVFKKISQSKPRPKVKPSVVKTTKKNAQIAKVITTTTVSKSKKPNKGKSISGRQVIIKNRDTGSDEEEEEEETQTDSSLLSFNPINDTGIDRELAQSFSTNKNEQDAFLLIFKSMKTAYDAEAAKEGRENNVAMALTFFIVTTSVVYHDSPEPSEETIEKVYQSLSNSMIENGNLSNFSDLDKQAMSDRLVYISGFVLFGYTLGKQTNDKATLDAYRTLAGVCLQSLMKIDPEKIKFNKNGLSVS
jgi:hypothetical protein